MSVFGTDRLCQPVRKHFYCWRLTGRAAAARVLLSLTATGPPPGDAERSSCVDGSPRAVTVVAMRAGDCRYGTELVDGVGVSSHSACGNGLPFVSGKNGAAITPTIKNRPTIVAALPKPPSATISVPAIRGPAQEIHRGALKQNATAVPRTRVGNSSGSQIGAHDQMPVVKKPKTATATSNAPIPCAHR